MGGPAQRKKNLQVAGKKKSVTFSAEYPDLGSPATAARRRRSRLSPRVNPLTETHELCGTTSTTHPNVGHVLLLIAGDEPRSALPEGRQGSQGSTAIAVVLLVESCVRPG